MGKRYIRIEVRKITVCTDISWLKKRHNWSALMSIVMVERDCEADGKTRHETRYFISSIDADAEFMAKVIRQYRGWRTLCTG